MTSFNSLLLIVCVSFCISIALAKPAVRSDDPPRLDDALAVAKSPLEPIITTLNGPESQSDELPVEKMSNEKAQNTRAAQTGNEQEKDATSVSAMNDSESMASTQSLTETTEAVSTTDSSEPESTTSSIDSESTATRSSTESETTIAPSSSTTTTPTTTTTQSPPPTTTVQPDGSSPSNDGTSESPENISTSEPSKEKTTELAKEVSSVSGNTETTAEPFAETSSETTPVESLPKTEFTTTTTTSSTTTQSSSDSDLSSTAAGATSNTESTNAPVASVESASEVTASPTTTTTTTSAPLPTTLIATTTTTSTTPSPVVSTDAPAITEPERTSASSTTVAPLPEKSEEKKVDTDEANKAPACNHLPTYQSDEIQKVFREETTYKNGTIKGKFTYINFDQRYRLVHYTRLPYGPVKIDLVEELGRPEQAGNQSSPPASNEAAFNSVLQLRNLLPNSLFDFPFSPRPQSSINKSFSAKDDEDTKSNMYFYSTENISTPNLLTPSVPVSVLPNQRRLSQPVNNPHHSDITNSGYYGNIPLQQQQQQQSDALPNLDQKLTGDKTPLGVGDFSPVFANPNQHQFQYAISSQAASPLTDTNKQQGLLYGYLSQAQAPPQYQYSPAPLYSFQQPSYYYTRALTAQPITSNLSNRFKQDQPLSESTSYVNHQTHQPHSHEHYNAPFMFNQPASTLNDQTESSRLKLKVKTSKALNSPELYTKSAQLRSSSSSGVRSSSTLNSPAQLHRQHRHRSGKQNQDLKANINNSPVVYHVLRSPAGRVYNLPQYQGYAMSYEHDD